MDRKSLLTIKDHQAPTGCLPSRYIVKASLETIKGENILFMSLYEGNTIKELADLKIFFNADSYKTQKLKDNKEYTWSESSLYNLIWGWNYSRDYAGNCVCDMLADRKIISEFFNVKVKNNEVYDIIYQFQKKVMDRKLKEKHNKIKVAIDNVMAKVSELPKDFDKWVYDSPFNFSHYVYYKREGKKIKSFCTECRKDFVINETEYTRRNIKHNSSGSCPKCNKKVVYKAVGKTTNLFDTTEFAILQQYEGGFIVRYFWGKKSYREHYRNPSLHYNEYVRDIYKVSGNSISFVNRYEYTYFKQTSDVRWCEDTGKIEIETPYLYTRNINQVLKGTKFQYSCLYQFAREIKHVYPIKYLTQYASRPGIEYLVKFKLFNLVNENIRWSYSNWEGVNFKGKTIKDVLGLEKSEFQQVQRLDLGKESIGLMKSAKEVGKVFTDSELNWITKNVQISDFKKMLKHTTPYRIIKYIKSQEGKKYSAESVLTDWCDYINQCIDLKFDIMNSFIFYPKNLKEKHEEYILMNKAKGFKKYENKVSKVYERLSKEYKFEDANYSIDIAKNVDEIIREGHRLRHCVGSASYINGVADGELIIMVVRKKESPEAPFYTLELGLKTLTIRQCRGYRNCDKTPDVEKFISKWKTKIIEKMKEVKHKSA